MMATGYLKISYSEEIIYQNADNYENRNKPFANSPVYEALVQDAQVLTEGADVKTVYRLQLAIKDIIFNFLPGDVIGILPENDQDEVEELLTRLNLEKVCHHKYLLQVQNNTTKKNAAVPKHLPACVTLYEAFLKYIDIRMVPKKLFLKSLIKFTEDTNEREKLELVCSATGSDEYTKFLSENRSLLCILNSIPSCYPPVELILEHSAPLNPRYFSIASSPLSDHLSIVFCVLTLPNGMKGVCTGWLEKLIKNKQFRTKPIPIYFRKSGNFCLNDVNVSSTPTILVATGTGIAPFLSLLEFKRSTTNQTLGLFYGCRYPTRDFLCGDLLKSYLKQGVLTKLYTAFSRESTEKQYVQHRITECKTEIVDLILNQGGSMFVCGDVKTVVKDVKETIIKCFMECEDIDRTSAEDVLNDLIKSGKFVVDTWT